MLIKFSDDIEVHDAISGLSMYDLDMKPRDDQGDYVFEVSDGVEQTLKDQGRSFIRLNFDED